MASPRPTLETYKYQMPGEKEAPVQHLFLFDMNDNSYKEICTSAFKDQTLRLARKPWRQKDRDRKEVASVWLGDNNRFFVTRSSRHLFVYGRTGFDLSDYRGTYEYLSGSPPVGSRR